MAPQPALRHLAEEAAAALPALLVAAERVAAAVAQGVHGRRRVGQGETFWQFRQYQIGDPIQRIDWRESAKSQRIYVRETEWEAAQSVWLWRDASASMDYASAKTLPSKRQRADLVTVALAALLIRGGERVTLLGSGRPPGNSRAVLNRLALEIERGQGAAGQGAAGQGAAGQGTAGGGAAADLPAFAPLPRYGQLVLIGDLLAPLEAIHALVGRFAALGVRGHLLQLLDPAEETLPFAGRIRFEGMESDESVLLSRVETVRAEYEARLRRHRDGLAAIARATGWTFGTHRTDRPPHTALLALYGAMAKLPQA